MTQFDLRQALRNLDIEVKPWGYSGLDGVIEPGIDREGLRGYSHDRWLAINPQERWPEMVTFHEMAHILRGDTTAYKKFNLDLQAIKAGKIPLWDPNVKRFVEYKETQHDIIEAECHATGIIACQLTGVPFDFREEMEQLTDCYTLGRQIPKSVMQSANMTAKKIWAAGKVDARSLRWSA